MTTVKTCLALSQELEPISDSARLDTEVLLAKAINKPRAFLYTWAEQELGTAELERFNDWFQRRLNGEPIAYILGEKEFWSLNFKVNAHVLIPRPETELLVETVLEILADEPKSILDLGTGSGAIALALAHERPNWEILGVDESQAAVALAIENCRALGLTNVAINRSYWYKNVQGRFDAIVCNPPYISDDDSHLGEGDVRFEPRSALVAAQNGLADLKVVITGAPNFMMDRGLLFVEHGWQQGPAVRELFSSNGFENINTKKDLAGHDRMTYAQRGKP